MPDTPTEIRLQDYRQAVVDANGLATIRMGTAPPFNRWIVDQLSVQISRGTGVATVTHGPTSAAPLEIDATRLGANNRTSPGGWELLPGETCIVSFDHCYAGATVSVTMRARQVAS